MVTVNEGVCFVFLKSTGITSIIVTDVLSVRPNSTKITPVVVFKKAKAILLNMEPFEVCHAFFDEKVRAKENFIKKWIDLEFTLIDQMDTAKLVKDHIIRRGILNVVITGSLTPYAVEG